MVLYVIVIGVSLLTVSPMTITYNTIYVNIEVNDILSISSIKLSSNQPLQLTILPLYKYKVETFNLENEANLQNLINTLDSDHRYNLTYNIPEGTVIEHPLDAVSFNNDNHIYNKFTITQYDTSNDMITSGTIQNISVVDR